MNNIKFWEQKNGTKIRIKDMTDLHLTNTIKMLSKNLECDCPSYYMKEDAPLADFCPLHGSFGILQDLENEVESRSIKI